MPTRAPTETERAIMRDVNARMPRRSVADDDPEDPAQTLDDVAQIDVAPLDVDAMPSAEAHDELLRAIAESKEGDLERADEAQPKETGKLYGVRTPHAADADLADGPDDGEHWLESLSQHATEGGAVPDDELVIIDETDDHGGAPPTERRDRPVADKGSGGAGGL